MHVDFNLFELRGTVVGGLEITHLVELDLAPDHFKHGRQGSRLALQAAIIAVSNQQSVIPGHDTDAVTRPRTEEYFGYDLHQAKIAFAGEFLAAIHDRLFDHGNGNRVGIGVGNREMLRLDVLRELILDLELDGREYLSARFFG